MGLNATLGPNGWEVDPIDDGIVRAKKDLTGRIRKFEASGRDALADLAVDVVDFVSPSGSVPTVAGKGSAVSFRANGAPVVASGNFLTSGAGTGQRAWYGEFASPERITRIGAEFKFAAGSGGKNGCIALIPWSDSVTASSDIPPTPLHFTVSRFGWSVGILETTNGVIENVGSGSFETTLSADTIYSAEAIIDGNTAYLTLPDGTVATVSDAAIASVVGTYAGFEFYQFDGATDDSVHIGRFWSGIGDQRIAGASVLSVASRKLVRQPSALTLTSVTSSSIPTSEALVTADAVCPVPHGLSNKKVLCRLTAWLNVTGGHSIIFAPKFKDVDGSVISQPYLFAVTAPAAGFAGYATVEFVQDVTTDLPAICEFRYLSTGAGDTIDAAANKPLTMSFVPLG